MNYRKTVQRTRMELHRAEEEHVRIEAVASLVRSHFMKHLEAYRQEIDALNEEWTRVLAACEKTAEMAPSSLLNEKKNNGNSMKDILLVLKGLGEELKAKGIDGSVPGPTTLASKEGFDKDWRVPGVGGISMLKTLSDDKKPEETERKLVLANGWILPGDKVITPSGEDGDVVSVQGPALLDSNEFSAQEIESFLPKSKNVADSSPVKRLRGSSSEETKIHSDRVGVRLANGDMNYFSSSELKFKDLSPLCFSDGDLSRRWEVMSRTASEMGLSHDVSGMDNYIKESLLRRLCNKDGGGGSSIAQSGPDADEKSVRISVNGRFSPKSVMQHDDLCSILPFGAGFMGAPKYIKTFPSAIPLDSLEETVRNSVFPRDAKGVRVSFPTYSTCFAKRADVSKQSAMY